MKTAAHCGFASRYALLAVLVLCVGVLPARSQTFRGTILGTVTDTSGAIVPGATVTVRNADTGLVRTTETQADGSYAVPELPIGTYDVTVDKADFQKFVTKGVQLTVAAEKRVDAELKPGQITEQILVSGSELPEIETVSDTLGGTLTQETVRDLPINGRDYTKLIYLNPGVAGSPDQITDSPGSFGEFSMNGARGRSNNYLLDGTDMNDGYRNDPAINQGGVFATPSAILPIDAVSDMRVLSNFEPEYGRNGGAVVNIVTRSGTNQIHGSAFEYFRNDVLDARNFFNTTDQPKSPFHNNQFGGALGGPIVKDKTFFFVDYEGQREKVGVVTLACVPDPAQIAADGGATNPVTAQMLKFWPAPNIPGKFGTPSAPGTGEDVGCPQGPNAQVITPSYNNLTSMIAKIDQAVGKNDSLTGRYFFGDSTQSFPLALNATGGELPGFNTVTPTRVQLVSLSYVHIFSSTKVNEIRYGWNRFAEGFFPQDQSFHPSSIGLCAASNAPGGTNPGPTCSGSGVADSGLPIILVSVTPSGGSSFFAQPGANSADPRHRVDTNNQFIDDFSWKLGKHDLKFGFEFRRTSVSQFFDKYFRGRLKFGNLSDFLAGDVASGLQYSGNTTRNTYENDFGLYAQDTFRITPRLTLNYGLRWDEFGVIGEKNNLFSNFIVNSFDPATDTGVGSEVQVGSAGQPRLYNAHYRNFGPRASIAWDVFGSGKTVVRTGWGMFFDSTSQDMFLGHLPYPAFYAPGPAYANFGPNPITESTTPSGTVIASGAPVYGASNCGGECDLFGVAPNIRVPFIENYNLNIQQQITSKIVLEVGYVGSQGHHLWQFNDINQPNAQAIHDAQCPGALGTAPGSDCSATPGATALEFGAPRVFSGPGVPPGTFYIFQENSNGRSNYNSLQVSLRVSPWHGFASTVNFVWSRSMDNSSDGEDFVPNAAQPADSSSSNHKNNYGPSNFNIPRRFTWLASYQLPTMSGGWQKLKNGWGVDSTLTLQTGQPFTLNYNGEDDFSGSGEGFDRPDVIGPITYNYGDPNNFLNLASFAMPCTNNGTLSGLATDCVPGTQHFGNLGRNALVGPPFKQWDMAFYKDTHISERLNLQLRAEFFNIVNHPNFSNPLLPAFIADPASNVNQNTCGCGFVQAGNREVGNGNYHIVATGDVGIGNPFLGGGGPRGIQLAAKFTF